MSKFYVIEVVGSGIDDDVELDLADLLADSGLPVMRAWVQSTDPTPDHMLVAQSSRRIGKLAVEVKAKRGGGVV